MTWFQCAIVFSCLWWMMLFCFLPVGMSSASDEGEPVKRISLRRKMWWATLSGGALALLAKVMMDTGWIHYDL